MASGASDEAEQGELCGAPHLPFAVIRLIFESLDGADVAHAACVCCTWRAAAQDEGLWALLFTRRWRDTGSAAVLSEGAHAAFKTRHQLGACVAAMLAEAEGGTRNRQVLNRLASVEAMHPPAWLLHELQAHFRAAPPSPADEPRVNIVVRAVIEHATRVLARIAKSPDRPAAGALLDAACSLSLLVDPGADVAGVRLAVAKLAEASRARFTTLGIATDDLAARLLALTAFLFHPPAKETTADLLADAAAASAQPEGGLGLGGELSADQFDDVENTSLACCLSSRRGLPITLAVLHIAVGASAGVGVAPVGAPIKFMTRAPPPEHDIFFDVYQRGVVLTRAQLVGWVASFGNPAGGEEWLGVAPTDSVVQRMVLNLLRMVSTMPHPTARPHLPLGALSAGIAMQTDPHSRIRLDLLTRRARLARSLGMHDIAQEDLRAYEQALL